MVAYKGRISMKQFMKDKPTKWGYKLFVLADSDTGYTSKSEVSTTYGLSYSAVMDLLHLSLLGQGYILYVDNFYTSPTLFSDLYKEKNGCFGTIRKKQTGARAKITFLRRLRGEMCAG